MNAFRRRLLAMLAAAPLWPSQPLAANGAIRIPRALGYVPWWMAAGWRDMQLAQLDRLVLFELGVQADGRVNDNDWNKRARDLAAFAREHDIPIEVTFAVHGDKLFNQLFVDARARRQLEVECERWLGQSYVAGLHLDVEAYAVAKPAA